MIQPVHEDLFAVVGNPVSHSLSPVMMNAAFRSLGIPAVYLALQIDSPVDDLKTLWETGFKGLSVTLPFKETVYRAAVSVDETAEAIGALNTLRRCDKGWEGINTDWIGATRAIGRFTRLRGKIALVIGAGGAARAVVYGLKREGARVTVSNRCIERGRSLSSSMRCDFISLPALAKSGNGRDFDIVVQCTSVGLMEEQSARLVPDSFFHPGMVVMETVYRPLWTGFLLQARQAGCTTVPGIDMLLHQGVAQLEWWLDRPVPASNGIDVMEKALKKALEDEQDIQKD